MRKKQVLRKSYQKKSYIPTIIIMSFSLILILVFGRKFSELVAMSFVDEAPTVDVLPQQLSVTPSAQSPDSVAPPEEPSQDTNATMMGELLDKSAQQILKLLVP